MTTPTLEAKLATIDVWGCSVPLPMPLNFGTYSITSREYVAIRVTTADGIVSDGVALSRRAPIDVAISDIIAPLIIGTNGLDINARLQQVRIATSAMDADGIMGRALSLVEICLWDILSQTAGLPLWRLLGGNPRAVPVLLVEGYTLSGESDEQFAERLAARADEGFQTIKIEAASYAAPEQLASRLSALRRLVDDRLQLVIDLAWSCSNAREAAATVRPWEEFNIAWLEDPIPRSLPREMARLRSAVGMPIGAGDEATRANELIDLLVGEAVDILRVDATAIGGIAVARDLVARADAAGLSVSTHVHPEVHQHITFATSASRYIEAFPLDRPFDATHRLMTHCFMDGVKAGGADPPTESGLGIHLDLAAVEHHAYRYSRVQHAGRPVNVMKGIS